MTEQELLVDCLQRLNGANIAYFLTGSMASNFWGIPRTTHDIDFVIQLPPRTVSALLAAFAPDFYLDEGSIRSAYQPPHQFNAIDLRSSLKVDFWLLKPAAFDRQMFERRKSLLLFSVPAFIASAEDVILHKLLWNRITPSERQLSDAAGVAAIQGAALDRRYLQEWAEGLNLLEDLARVLEGQIKPKQT